MGKPLCCTQGLGLSYLEPSAVVDTDKSLRDHILIQIHFRLARGQCIMMPLPARMGSDDTGTLQTK